MSIHINDDYAFFDKITNSEDKMIESAGIPRYQGSTYLRAYIMASLCFEPYFVISDTSVNLNRAFRTLVDYNESGAYKTTDLPEKADFDRLIETGHIRFAARDTFKGNFSDTLRIFEGKPKKKFDLPSEEYIEKITGISSNDHVYWYNLDKVSHKFTSNFRNAMDKKLYRDADILPEHGKLLRMLIHRLSGEETFTYKDVTAILTNEYKLTEEDTRYQYIRGLLRQSYDYNVPDSLGLDYCMSLNNILPLGKQNWKFELTRETEIDCYFLCNVYGLAALPSSHLEYIWDSTPGRAWQQQLNNFRAGIFDMDKYVETLNNYLLKINDVVADNYPRKNVLDHNYKKPNLSRLPLKIYHYVTADDRKMVLAKLASGAWNILRSVIPPDPLILGDAIFKILPNLAQKSVDFPQPPSEVRDAIIMQYKEESSQHGGPETK